MILFGLLTYGSMRVNRGLHRLNHQGRYYWWGSVRLDSNPLNKQPMHPAVNPCAQDEQICGFNPESIWVTPGLMEWAFTLSSLPTYLLCMAVVRGFAHFGVSELLSFMITMPLLTLAWFYAAGWLFDRWRYKRSLRRSSVGASLT